MIQRKWHVSTSCCIELFRDRSHVFEGRQERVVPTGLAKYVPDSDHAYELEIAFISRGYYDPGSMYGGPDNLGSPPEGDDERTLEHMLVHVHKSTGHIVSNVPPALADELFEFFRDDVEVVQLPDND
jgi:hypothetical protein